MADDVGAGADAAAGDVAAAASFAGIDAGLAGLAAFAGGLTTGIQARSASRAVAVLEPFALLGDSEVGRIRDLALLIEDSTAAGPADTGHLQPRQRLVFGKNAPKPYLPMEVGPCYQAGVSDAGAWSRWSCGRNYSIPLA